MQFINLTTGALDKIDMAGMQRIKLTKYHADFSAGAETPVRENGATPPALRAGAFNFGIQKLA
jgi:hypothetical protein